MGRKRNPVEIGSRAAAGEGQGEGGRVYETLNGKVLIRGGYWCPDTRWARQDDHKWLVRRNELLDVIRPRLTHTRIALDVGGFVGLWARPLSEIFDRVIAYEPIQENYECLKQNALGATSLMLAVGDRPAPVKMGVHGANFGHVDEGGDREAFMVPLDLIMSEGVDFIKIDVDGSELLVLEGGKRIIAEQRPVICIEAKEHRTEIEQVLRSYGYRRVYQRKPDEVWVSDRRR